jgi:monoamine oxidase
MTLLFDRPFWRGQLTDAYWMLDEFHGCCLYDESSRVPESDYGILGWLLGGDDAERLSHLDDAALIEKALGSLPPFLQDGRQHFVEGRVHRWIGAVNALPGGDVPENCDRRHQPEPVEHAGLFVVGDYLFDSTLNGVLDSASWVAHWIASRLADSAVTQSHS